MLIHPLTYHWPMLAAGLTPAERWQAAREPFAGFGGMMWLVVVLVLAGLAALSVAALAVHGRWQRRRHRREFLHRARKSGLSGQETRLLFLSARSAGLKDPTGIFTMVEAFDGGTIKLLETPGLLETLGQEREAAATAVGILREKLGFQNAPPGKAGWAIQAGGIPPATTVSIFRQREQDYFDATVVAATEAGKFLEVLPETPITCQPGEAFKVRYTEEGILWEISVLTVKQVDDRLVLKPAGTARCVNRRRFPRTPIAKPAFIANFPFMREGAPAGPPGFVSGELVEIAGPGLKIITSLKAEVGDKVLAGVKFSETKVLQGLAVIRRSGGKPPDDRALAMELVGLTGMEIGELIRETNLFLKAAVEAKRHAEALVEA